MCKVHLQILHKSLYHEQKTGETDRWHERLKLFFGGNLVVHRCDPWKLGEILHAVSIKYGAVYVGKHMTDIHVTGTSYIKMEFLTLKTSVFVPHFQLTLPNLTVLYLHVLVCDLNLQ